MLNSEAATKLIRINYFKKTAKLTQLTFFEQAKYKYMHSRMYNGFITRKLDEILKNVGKSRVQ